MLNEFLKKISFSKKNGPIMSPDQNPHQTVTLFVCVGFPMYACPKCDNFACLHTRQVQNELHLKSWYFCQIVKSNVAIFPCVIQGYTHPYSFGGRIKLVICQIRHDLSVTIHEISTSWKKTLDGGPNITTYCNCNFFQCLTSLTLSLSFAIGLPSKISFLQALVLLFVYILQGQ